MKINIGIPIDLEKLTETRLLIQANSGGGKSYAIRKLLEETNGKVQQIVLDLEGEFSTLREKCDFVIFGKDADYPVNIKYADKIARSLLELNASAIIDLYELKHHERITFVKRFLESMINAPKELWHACLVVIDEAHIFAPEKGNAESMSAVIDLCTRGRKRGFCSVLATQRLSKLHKDAAAECNNKLIGRTGLDVDMKRASEELGFTSKQDMLSLRELEAGNFFAFGPAISNKITQFKVAEVKTTHPRTGQRFIAVPPATDKIKNVLAKIKDLPQEAEKELKDLADYKQEITSLRRELTQAKKLTPVVDSTQIQQLKTDLNSAKIEIVSLKKEVQQAYNLGASEVKNKVQEALKGIQNKIPEQSVKIVPTRKETALREVFKPAPRNYERLDGKITGGAMRMLKAAAMFYPSEISKARMGAIAGLSSNSGTFGTYIATLKKNGFLTGEGKTFIITEEGLTAAGEVSPLPTDPESLVNMWSDIIKGGASRMLKVLFENYPNAMSKQELGEAAGITHTSGTFGTYLATLKRNGLIKVYGGNIKLADEFFGEE